MWIFVLFFFSITFCYTVLNLSLVTSKKVYGIALAITLLIPFSLYQLSAQQTNQTLEWISNQPNLVSGIAMLQVFESFLMLFFTVIQLKAHYTTKPKVWTTWIANIPSGIFLIGIFFLQTYLFLAIDNINYIILAFSLAIGIGILLFLSSFFIKKLFKDWGIRAEIKALIAVFQLLAAMFLPLIAKGHKVTFTQITIELTPILFTVIVISALAGIGYLIYKRKNNSIL
ncbi:hypothetical protein [Aquimarina rhabdastrellae]